LLIIPNQKNITHSGRFGEKTQKNEKLFVCFGNLLVRDPGGGWYDRLLAILKHQQITLGREK
jgi:hypothetical protein